MPIPTNWNPQSTNATNWNAQSVNSSKWSPENLQPIGGILLLQTGGDLLLQDGVSDFLLQ